MALNLDARQRQILADLAAGASDRDLAKSLGIEERDFLALWHEIEDVVGSAQLESSEDYALALDFERIERKRLEKEVWAGESRLNALMDIASEAIFVVNGHNGRILKVNNAASVMLGYTPRELIGQLVEVLVPDELKKVHVAYRQGFLRSVRKRELGYHPPIAALCKDGSTILMDIALTATQATDDVMVVCQPIRSPDLQTPSEAGKRSQNSV